MWVFGKRTKKERRGLVAANLRRRIRPELLESRLLMAADPVHVGMVYIEQDQGSDDLPDMFIVSFTGGAPDTELTELQVSTDKRSDGVSEGDLIFDTELGGIGKDAAHPFAVHELVTADPRASVVGIVEDGGQLLTLQFRHFQAGDKLKFTIDVDEVLWVEPNGEINNDELDVIVSGQEFHRSLLAATFAAPHFELAAGQDIFLNNYGDPQTDYGLDLPIDLGGAGDQDNRTAGAIATTQQVPKPVSIAGTVFADDNLNLNLDAGETLLRDVEIELWKLDTSTNQYVDTGFSTRTDANGNYQFGTDLGLTPGTYRVIETQPDGYFSVGAIPGTVAGADTGMVETADILSQIALPLGDLHAVDFDFAEARPAAISGYVYRDDSDDGMRDAGEPGIGGVRVRLVPINTIATQTPLVQTTAADGSYRFEGLSPGTYRIEQLDQPAPYTDGLDRAGTVNGVQVGAAVNPGDEIRGISLIGGVNGIEYNFGELPLGSIAGGVYLVPPGEDCDDVGFDDGIPLEGVEVRLFDEANNLVAVVFTGADGRYRFDDVPKGTYRIEEITPPGLLDGDASVGRIDGIEVGVALVDGSLSEIRLPAGRDGESYDFCEAAPSSVSGYVYHDRSNDGSRDAGELGIPDATVRLIDAGGNVVGTQQTDASGYYEFRDILPGTYRLEEITPAGYLDGLDRAGTVAGVVKGQAVNPGDVIQAVSLRQGQAGVEYNFGELLPATISGQVHADLDDDCTLDPNEQTLSGVVIRLLDAGGQQLAETSTDADGRYEFTGLRPGKYTVVQEQPAGFFDGGLVVGSTGGLIDVANQIREIPVGSGDISVQNNFCEHPPSEISGNVHVDRNGDGVRSASEPWLSGVTLELLDENGQRVATTTTNDQGYYEFTELRQGRYSVRETQPVGYLQGGQRAGSKGGDAGTTDWIQDIEIGWGENLIDYDFWEIDPSSISGSVFVDSNGNCVHEPILGERSLAGVTIRLHDADGRVLQTTQTDANGDYHFANLRPGTYRVSEVQPVGYFQGSEVVGSGGGRILADDLIGEIMLGANQDFVDYDFCEIEPSSIGGMVFIDSDEDCVYEPTLGESPLLGVEIRLHDETGNIIATTTTDASGRYHFANLAPGTYRISEVQPIGFFQGGQVVGSGGGVVLADDLIGEIELGPGQDLVDYDFCEVEPSSLAGSVFVDSDGDCFYEPHLGERPLENVVVHLQDEQGTILETTRTDAQGRYEFSGLRPGRYRVAEVQPVGFFQGGQVVGSGGGSVLADDLIGAIEIGPGQQLTGYDFCEVVGGSLSGRVWVDQDTDGEFDNSEQPLENVVIDLLDVNGAVVASTTTDVNGNYQFVNLPPGIYSVRQYQPLGLFHGGQHAGSHGGDDSLADIISAIAVPGGGDLIHYDFPEVPPASISGFVFQDGRDLELREAPAPEELRRYQDGVLTSDDQRLAGVTLELRNLLGDAIDGANAIPGTYTDGPIRVVTDENGFYEFTGLRPRATYHVYQVQPDGFIDGLDTPGETGNGLAVNTADFASNPQLGAIVSTLALSEETNPGTDAILSIFVTAGQRINNNNFSEIRIDPPTPGPPGEDPQAPVNNIPDVGFDTFLPPERPFLGWTPPPIDLIPWFVWRSNVSWHLSVINGGQPRDAGIADEEVFIPAANEELMKRWSEAKANNGQWEVYDAEGQPLEGVRSIVVGVSAGIPVVGDFDGDGQDEAAIYIDGEWLVDLNGNGRWDSGDLWLLLGSSKDRPVVGDWDGDGKQDVGIFGPEWQRDPQVIRRDAGLPGLSNRSERGHKNLPPTEGEAAVGKRFLRNTAKGKMHADVIDHVFRYGVDSDVPLVGDWNGDAIDTIAVFRGGVWQLDADGDGRWSKADVTAVFGQPGDIPVVGDWNGDGIDELAVVRGDVWIIDTDGDRRLTAADLQLRIPRDQNQVPVMGDWDGDGRDQPGLYRYQESRAGSDSPAA